MEGSIFEKGLKILPVLGVVAALTYGLGLVVSWSWLQSQGAGIVQVQKERALAVGVSALIQLTPFFVWINAYGKWRSWEEKIKSGSETQWKRAGFLVGLLSIEASLCYVAGTVLLLNLGSTGSGVSIWLALVIPAAGLLFTLSFPKECDWTTETRHWSFMTGHFLLVITLPALLTKLYTATPPQLGGPVPADVSIELKDKTKLVGRVLASDSQWFVIQVGADKVTLASSEVFRIVTAKQTEGSSK